MISYFLFLISDCMHLWSTLTSFHSCAFSVWTRALKRLPTYDILISFCCSVCRVSAAIYKRPAGKTAFPFSKILIFSGYWQLHDSAGHRSSRRSQIRRAAVWGMYLLAHGSFLLVFFTWFYISYTHGFEKLISYFNVVNSCSLAFIPKRRSAQPFARRL